MTNYYKIGQKRRRHILPDKRALYIWTADIGRLVSFSDDAAVDELHRIIRTTRRQFGGRVEPYYEISLHDCPKEMTARKSNLLKELLNVDDAHRSFFLLASSVLQRPLYVGKAISLKTRIRSHLRRDSRLMAYLKDANLTIEECCLSFVVLPDLAANADEDEEIDDDEIDDEESEDPDDEYEDVDEEPAEEEEDVDEAVPVTTAQAAPVPTSRAFDLDLLEALVIRMSRPLLVRKQE